MKTETEVEDMINKLKNHKGLNPDEYNFINAMIKRELEWKIQILEWVIDRK